MKIIDNSHRFNNCPLCGSSDIYKIGNLKYAEELFLSTIRIQLTLLPELWKCRSCYSSFTQNTIPVQIAEELYSTGMGSKRWAYESFEQDKTEAVSNYFKGNSRLEGKKLLDVGCNTGEFLDFASKFKAQTYGLEICKESCELLKQKGHVAFQSSLDINETFDIVTAFDVFEHIYDVKGFLKFVGSILRPSGLFILLTGNPQTLSAKFSNEKWWYFNYPEHVVFPSSKYFNQHIEGYSVVEVISTYANKAHQSLRLPFFSRWQMFFKKYRKKEYNGIPAIFPDHQFVVLKKK